MTDVLDELAGVIPPSPLVSLRASRAAARRHAQDAYEALFSPARSSRVSAYERAAVALRVAGRHQEPRLIDHYRSMMKAPPAVTDLLAGDRVADGGELAAAGVDGDLVPRLAAALRHADLLATRPIDARPGHLAALRHAGLGPDEIVTISQLIGFVSFQARVLAGLLLLAGKPPERDMSGPRIRTAVAARPFTQDRLGWSPWVEPLARGAATPQQEAALPGPKAASPYFRLLARDTPVLLARTALDESVFRAGGGLPRGERELAAVVASRINGCVYCASVHARFASTYTGRGDDVSRLLDEGVEAEQHARWRGLVDLTALLSQTPSRAELTDVAALRRLGLSPLEVFDAVQASAFFAWANRLMLTLGEPDVAD